MDKIVFEIKWSGGQEADLDCVIDNEHAVPMEARRPVPPKEDDETPAEVGPPGRGLIRFQYEADPRPVHTVEWSLTFPGKTLSKLKATVKVNAKEEVSKEADGDQKGNWAEMIDA